MKYLQKTEHYYLPLRRPSAEGITLVLFIVSNILTVIYCTSVKLFVMQCATQTWKHIYLQVAAVGCKEISVYLKKLKSNSVCYNITSDQLICFVIRNLWKKLTKAWSRGCRKYGRVDKSQNRKNCVFTQNWIFWRNIFSHCKIWLKSWKILMELFAIHGWLTYCSSIVTVLKKA